MLVACFLCAVGFSQTHENEYNPALRYEDRTYKSNIHTVQLHQPGWKFSPAVIAIHSGDQLLLEFDDFDGDDKQYSYTLIHCDADWQPSDMVPFDYLKGFTHDMIRDYAYSFNTFQRYTHYRLPIPNNNMQMIVSGNYLLKVFTYDNEDSLVITRRLMVYENGVSIRGREKPGIGEEIFTKQQILFDINTYRANITDPFHALQIFISQNGRWDNAISGIEPQFAADTSLQYESDFGQLFDGNNQFRSFDMTSLRYLTEHEDEFVSQKLSYEIRLKPDLPRGDQQYYTFQDIGGQYLILNKDYDSSTISSEYVYIDFFMPSDSEITSGNMYVFGALSDWQCKPEFEMYYNADKKGYVGQAYLKQGYYEYMYAYLKHGSKVADLTLIEGNHTETTNNYFIYAYYRPQALYYDRLIGFTTIHAPSN